MPNKRGGGHASNFLRSKADIQHEMQKLKREIKHIDPDHKSKSTLLSGKKDHPHIVKIQINNQTFVSLIASLLYLIVQIIIFKKTTMSYYHILLLIFIWPTFIEILCRSNKQGGMLAWFLCLMPLILIMLYEGYIYREDKDDKKKHKKK